MNLTIFSSLSAVVSLLVASCASSATKPEVTPTLLPRPSDTRMLGEWYSKVGLAMTKDAKRAMDGYLPGKDVEIVVLPGRTPNDEFLMVKHSGWKDKFDSDAEFFRFLVLYFSLDINSKEYKLNPLSVIEVHYKSNPPYGVFDPKDPNLVRYCEIPWKSVQELTPVGDGFQSFLLSWKCTNYP